MKGEFEGKIVAEFVGLKSKILFIKKFNGKEYRKRSSTAKGVSVATEFSEFKDNLFNKKLVRHKIRRSQSKKLRN